MHVIGTAGHVDHGKSALVTRLTGIDPDRFEEEKRRGLTIDLGFAWLALPSGLEVGIVDVPGHERFIGNMLAGAGAVTACMFVVAATEGWMPQSAEHLTALEVLGVSRGVVALTKTDLVDPETVAVARLEVVEHLEGSVLGEAPVVPCSAATGEGVAQLVAALDDVLAGSPAPADEGRPRLWIDRVFTIQGAGTVVTGTTAGGSFAAGDAVALAPSMRTARIRSIQTHHRRVERIGPGNRAALNLAGLERGGAERGDAAVRPGLWRPTRELDAMLHVPGPYITGHGRPVTEKGAHLLYSGSAETAVRIRLLDRAELGPGERAPARLRLSRPLVLARGDRFVLRDAGRVLTLGGGMVLDPHPGRVRRDRSYAGSLARLAEADGRGAVAELVTREGLVDAVEAALRSGLLAVGDPATPLPPGISRLGPVLVSRVFLRRAEAGAGSRLADYHSSHPLEAGMPREELRAHLGLQPEAFDALVASLPGIEEEGSVVRLATHAVELDPSQRDQGAAIVAALEEGRFAPPTPEELGADPALLRALAARGEIVRVGSFYLSAPRAEEARRLVRRRIQESGPQTVAQIRDLLQTSRRYAVPLCEWLDETGVTRRQGDVRVLGPRA